MARNCFDIMLNQTVYILENVLSSVVAMNIKFEKMVNSSFYYTFFILLLFYLALSAISDI